MIKAGIDIGTNTALLVIADVDTDRTTKILADAYEVPRLGEGLASSGVISEEACQRTASALSNFRTILEQFAPSHVRAVATSAMREARNSSQILAELECALGNSIDVISGEVEAELTFNGAVGVRNHGVVMIDIGGGSTEFAYGVQGQVLSRETTNLGAVRLTEQFAHAHEPMAAGKDSLRATIRLALAPLQPLFKQKTPRAIGVAGTPTALAMLDLELEEFDAAVVDGYCITAERVRQLSDWLLSLTADDLRNLPGLHARRADIVPVGSMILAEALEVFNLDTLEVTVRGLRYGLLQGTSL